MRLSLKRHALTTAVLALLTAASHAVVLINDNFTAAGTASWFTAGNDTDGVLSNVSNQLRWNAGTTASAVELQHEIIGKQFTAATLAVGQTIRLTFDYTAPGNQGIIRVGFYDLTGRAATANNWALTGLTTDSFQGYTTFARDASASGNVARDEIGTFNNVVGLNQAGTSSLGSGPTMAAINNMTTTTITSPTNSQNYNIAAQAYKVQFDVKLVSASQVETTFKLSSGVTDHFTIIGVDSATPYTTFDTVVLRADLGVNDYDNIKVEVIPEPHAALLGGLGLLALLRRRR